MNWSASHASDVTDKLETRLLEVLMGKNHQNMIAFQLQADHPRMCVYLRSHRLFRFLAAVTLTLTR